MSREKGGIRARGGRLAVALTGIGSLLVAGGAVAAADSPTSVLACSSDWSTVPTAPRVAPSSYSLSGVAAAGINDVWAVGKITANQSAGPGQNETLIEHWDGFSWNRTASPSPAVGTSPTNSLMGVAAVSPIDVWAVGASGAGSNKALVEHYNGVVWSVVPAPTPGTASSLWGVSATGLSDVWAVGSTSDPSGIYSQGLVEHWNGTKWDVIPDASPPRSSLSSVTVLSPTDVWAVGFYAVPDWPFQTFTEHWDGTRWTSVAGLGQIGGVNGSGFYGVAGAASNDVWGVGVFGVVNGAMPLVAHWNGSRWTQFAAPGAGPSPNGVLNGVAVVAANDVWAVGNYATTTDRDTLPLIEHWDGTTWTVSPPPSGATGGWDTTLNSVTVGDRGEWAVGGGDADSISVRRCNSLITTLEHKLGSFTPSFSG